MKVDIYLCSYLAHFFSEWEMSQTEFVEKIKTHILCSVNFLRKSCRLWENVEKCDTAGQVTGDKMAHAHCVLDTQDHRHTLTVCNTHWFSIATMVTRTRLIVTLYVHWLYCYEIRMMCLRDIGKWEGSGEGANRLAWKVFEVMGWISEVDCCISMLDLVSHGNESTEFEGVWE
jgi:hypothetical protein